MTSLEFAKKQIYSFDIVGTVDNIDLFMSKKNQWFKDNYSVDLKWDKADKVNSSIVNYEEVGYTTDMLKGMLTEEEKQLILKNNDIDYAIYEYVRGMEND